MSFGDIGRRQDGMSASLSEKSTFTPTQISQQIGALTKRGFQTKEKITELRRRKASQQEKIDLDKELGQLRLDVNRSNKPHFHMNISTHSLGAQIDIQKLKLDKLDKAAASSSSASASSGGDTGVQRAAIHKLAKDFERVRANMDVLFTEASLVKVQVGVEGVGVGLGTASLGGAGGRGMIRLKSVDIDEAIVLERERDIKKLANDLELVHDMYKDMASLVDRQGEHVDKIHSHEQAKGGLEQVKQAAAYQPGCSIC
eukprot:gene31713-38325_t